MVLTNIYVRGGLKIDSNCILFRTLLSIILTADGVMSCVSSKLVFKIIWHSSKIDKILYTWRCPFRMFAILQKKKYMVWLQKSHFLKGFLKLDSNNKSKNETSGCHAQWFYLLYGRQEYLYKWQMFILRTHSYLNKLA